MKYNVELIKQENYKPTFWSGGMATELITYPLDSNYASRNFLWRLGVAKIDILESTFSTLPNISRKFMVIEGQLKLDHENKYTKLLNSFEQDSFSGDWKTKTYGFASAFNLMTNENYHGELIHLNISPKKEFNFKYEPSINKDIVAICFYVVNESFKTFLNDKIYSVNTNDLLLINDIKPNSTHTFMFSNESLGVTNIVASIIYTS